VSSDAKKDNQNALKATAVAFPGLLLGSDHPSENEI